MLICWLTVRRSDVRRQQRAHRGQVCLLLVLSLLSPMSYGSGTATAGGGEDARGNAVKAKLLDGGVAVGTAGTTDGSAAWLSRSDFDFLLFDCQHHPLGQAAGDDIKQLGPVIASMAGQDTAPIVRVGENRADQICYALDAGAKGVVIPMVSTRQQAEDAVQRCKYHPLGVRSNAGPRGDWGSQWTMDDPAGYRKWMDFFNEQILVLPMVETVEALENIDEICTVPGVDVVLVGPSDLSINLDCAIQYTHPKYIAALEKISAACSRAGVVFGMYFQPPGLSPAKLIEMGCRFFTVSWQELAMAGVADGLAKL